MKLTIKNMNCPATKYFVKVELDKLGIGYSSIELGEVEISSELSNEQMNKLRLALPSYGLELQSVQKTSIDELLNNYQMEKLVVLQYSDLVNNSTQKKKTKAKASHDLKI